MESLCCGTPVAGFQAGGPEQIALPEFSRFVQWGDIRQLSAAVETLLALKDSDITTAECSARVYSKNTMAEGYMALYAN